MRSFNRSIARCKRGRPGCSGSTAPPPPHVVRRAHHGVGQIVVFAQSLGDAKVSNLNHLERLGEKHVGWLDIAVEDGHGVDVVETWRVGPRIHRHSNDQPNSGSPRGEFAQEEGEKRERILSARYALAYSICRSSHEFLSSRATLYNPLKARHGVNSRGSDLTGAHGLDWRTETWARECERASPPPCPGAAARATA